MKRFNFLLKKDDKIKLSILLLLLLISTFLEFIGIGSIPIFVSIIFNPDYLSEKFPFLDEYNLFKDLDRNKSILITVTFIITIFIIKNAFIIFVNYWTGIINKSIRSRLYKNLFFNYTYSNYLFYLNRNSSELIRNLTTEVAKAVKYLMSYLMLTRELLILIMIFTLLFVVDFKVSSVIFVFLGSFSLIFYFLTKEGSKKRGEKIQLSWGLKIKTITQSINSIKQIKILSKENFVNDIFKLHIDEIEKNDFVQKIITSLPRVFFELIAVFAIMIICLVYIYFERDFNNFIPFITLITISSLRLIPSFSAIAVAFTEIKHTYPAFILLRKETEDLNINIKDPINNKNTLEFNEEIELNNVNFEYPNSKKTILENVNLKIRIGETIGITGTSGAGKSTLLDLLVGLLHPTNGKILIDGKKFEKEKGQNWIKNVGYVPQEPYLLDDSIKSNIAFGESKKNFNLENYKSAVKLAQLDNFINSLEKRDETIVGEKGIKLSGGQRQRISLARCFYFKPKLILLDEPTSSLDVENEEKIMNEIYDLNIDATLIIISHRYSIFKRCKKIFYLDKKNLNKFDSFKELINYKSNA